MRENGMRRLNRLKCNPYRQLLTINIPSLKGVIFDRQAEIMCLRKPKKEKNFTFCLFMCVA